MSIPRRITFFAQLPQPVASRGLVLQAVEDADRSFEGLLAACEFVGRCGGTALDRRTTFDACKKALHRIDHSVLGERGADRDAARAVANRWTAVERIVPVVRGADDHAGAARTAAQDVEAREQPLRFRPAAPRDADA